MELGNITPEQAQELQKKLENMSPEELKEFQKKQCIFCHIVEGKTSSKKIYEDDKALAIMDINPASTGHLLLLPKEHYTILPQIPEEIVDHLFMVTKALSHSVLRALQCQGTTVFVANGVAAGQKAQHFMIHIIPRYDDDNVGLDIPENKVDKKDIETVQKRLVKKIKEVLGNNNENNKKEENNKEKIKTRVMEAEFEEEKKEKPIKEKPKEKEQKKKKETKMEKEEVDLDDIAKVLGIEK